MTNNKATLKLIGVDKDDNALFVCSCCGGVISLDSDGTDDIDGSRIGEACPECGAEIIGIDLE